MFTYFTSICLFQPKKHYLCVSYDTPMPAVTQFIDRYWGMKNPNIVLSVLSSEEQFKPWKSQRLKDDFQKGVIKVRDSNMVQSESVLSASLFNNN